MNPVDILIDEHENVKRALALIKKMSMEIIRGKDPDTGDFYLISSFISDYADAYHHGKEEEILFKYMEEESGPEAKILVRQGMLVEHDLGRYYNRSLRENLEAFDRDGSEDAKLDILTHALAYRNLLTRHIDKENAAVFTLAQRTLSDETMNKAREEFDEFCQREKDVKDKYLQILTDLEEKYS